MQPQILITNDDGIESPGLAALADALSGLGTVLVVAPDRERSATSHCITVHDPLRYDEIRLNRFAVNGTPADCVIVATNRIMEKKPALVVSGVNRGLNVGDDVSYSGTIAAATEAVLQGIPAIAISTAAWNQPFPDFVSAARIAARLAQRILECGLPPDVLLNVNFPVSWNGDVLLTRQGRRGSKALLVENLGAPGREHFWLEEIHSAEKVLGEDPMSDHAAVDAGYVSVSPISLDRTAHHYIKRFASWMDGVQF